MSVSDSDDFVEVNGYQSSDSDEWEKIDYSSEEDKLEINKTTFPHEVVQSYYNEIPTNHTLHVQDQEKVLAPHVETEKPIIGNKESIQKATKNSKKKQWTKVFPQQGQGAPCDPVEFLGITGSERVLLNNFGVATIGQLAYFDVLEYVDNIDSKKASIILDLQERAYEAVSTYITKSSSQPEIVWGYVYLGEFQLAHILKKGYVDSDSLCFLWTPMPTIMYRDQIAIDNIVGKDNNNKELRDRYSRFVKINLSKLCNKYYGRLYQKDPINAQKWIPTNLMEVSELSKREDLWCDFEIGNDIFSSVCHGSIVVPTGRIPKDCVELDKVDCSFSHHHKKREGRRERAQYEREEEDDEYEEDRDRRTQILNTQNEGEEYPRPTKKSHSKILNFSGGGGKREKK